MNLLCCRQFLELVLTRVPHIMSGGYYCSSVEWKPSSSPSALVIRIGFAGLTAAHAFQNASFMVTLLESKDRMGGRAYTHYKFGFPADMGAAWLQDVCEAHPLWGWLCQQLANDGLFKVIVKISSKNYACLNVGGNKVIYYNNRSCHKCIGD